MDLFSQSTVLSLLPHDGETIYHGPILTRSEADQYFDTFMAQIAWKHDEAKIFGKHFITKRMAAWYGDSEFDYTYSKVTKHALIWTPELLELKAKVEAISGDSFNSCLLNLYHDGSEGMGWHSDDEKTLGEEMCIASVSLGAERNFAFKHKRSKEKVTIFLQHGSLLLMKGATQKHWLHRLPPTKKVTRPRINLTFRTIMA